MRGATDRLTTLWTKHRRAWVHAHRMLVDYPRTVHPFVKDLTHIHRYLESCSPASAVSSEAVPLLPLLIAIVALGSGFVFAQEWVDTPQGTPVSAKSSSQLVDFHTSPRKG